MKTILNLILFIPFLLSAKTPSILTGPKPDWVTNPGLTSKKLSSRNIKDGYYLSQLEEQVNVDQQASYFRVIRQIVSKTGIQNASEISVGFDPTYEKLQFHSIIVWRNNKPINKLQLKNFKIIADEEELSKFIYQGTYSAFLILDDIRQGDKIEFSYTRTGRNPIFQNKYSDTFYLQSNQPIAHDYISVMASSSRKLNLKYFNEAAKAKISNQSGSTKYVWESFDQQPIEYEENTPGWFDINPKVQFSEYESWAEVAGWANEINKVSENPGGNCTAFAADLKQKYGQNQEEIYRAALQFVQDEVRYMGIETGEYSHRANAPLKVFNQRYGDCKDKSLLLASILKACNIEAHIALINTYEKEHLKQYLPDPQLFNHAVAVAKINGKLVWADATMQNQGGKGTKLYFPDYKVGLIADQNTTQLTDIPSPAIGKYSCFERYIIDSHKAPVKLTVKTIYTLNEADYFREKLASKGLNELEKNYFKYYKESYPKIKSLDTLVVKDNRLNNEIITIETYLLPDFFYLDSVSGNYKSNFYADAIDDILPKLQTDRKQPIYVGRSIVEHEINAVMDGGWNIDSEGKQIKRDDYLYEYYSQNIADTMKLQYRFEYLNSYIPAERVATFADDIKTLKDDYLSDTIFITPESAPFYPNWSIIAFSAFLVAAAALAGYLIYNQKNHYNSFYHKVPLPLSGWLLFVMFALAGHVSNGIYHIYDYKLLDLNTWEYFESRHTNNFYKVFITIKLFTQLYIIYFAGFCLFLMFKRRDILPKLISFYLGTSAILTVVIHILTINLYGEAYSSFWDTAYKVIISFVGIAYFKNSEQVHETFVVRKTANYSQEEEEELEETEAN